MKVRDLMTPDPVTVGPETPVQEIARLLLERRINGVPVVDSDGALLGIVTEGDLVHRAADERLQPRESVWKEHFWRSVFRRDEPETDRAQGRTAAEVMTRRVIAVTPDTDAAVAARLLVRHRIKALPVVEGNRVVGMVSRLDFLRQLAADPDAFNPLGR